MQKSVKKNYIFNAMYQLLLLIVPFITTPYLSRVLGANSVGIYSYANAMVSYFILFACLGTGTYGQRSISYVQEDKEKRSRVFWETFYFRLIMSLITLVFYGIYVFTLKENRIIFLILSLNLVNLIFEISWFFQGMEDFKKTVLRSGIVKILNIIFIFTCVKTSDDLVLYVLGTMILTVLGSMSLWSYLPKYIVKVKDIKPFRDIKTIIKLFIPTIAIQVYTIVDKSMIGWFSGVNYFENGYYEQAEKVIKICLTLVTSLGTVMIPRIGKTFKEGNTEKVSEYMYKSYRFIWLLSIPVCLGLISISSIFVPVFFGPGYEKVETLLMILSLLVIIIGMSNANGYQYFVPTGKENILTITVVIGAITNLILNSILIPKYYSLGASISSVVAEFLVTFVGFIYIRKAKCFSLRRIVKESIKYLISGLVMFIVLLILKQYLDISVISLAILIITGAIIYLIMLLILKDEFVLKLIKDFTDMVKRRINRKK